MLDVVTFINPVWYSIENFVFFSILSDLHSFCCWWSFYINIIIPNIRLQNIIVVTITITVNPTSFLYFIYWAIYNRWQKTSLKIAFHLTTLILNKLGITNTNTSTDQGEHHNFRPRCKKPNKIWNMTWLLYRVLKILQFHFLPNTNLFSFISGCFPPTCLWKKTIRALLNQTFTGASVLPTDL